MLRLSFLFLLVNLTTVTHAQQFGGTPPSQKWKQLNTDTARVIFPTGLDSTAQRVASVVHELAKRNTLGNELHKINIVLQHQTTIGNGYVGLGPYRSEFFLTPILNNFQEGSIPWPDQLAVHEYRHVQQFNSFRHGISKAMYYLFGEEGLALATNASVPDWFYEGDAVYHETVLTRQGRGRLPLFQSAFPSLWQSGKNYSWMKLRNGSLKDYVPSHYHLGYLLVNYGQHKYGSDFWRKVTRDASGFKGLFYPFQHAIRRHAGIKYKTFLQNAEGFYKEEYGKNSTEASSKNPESRSITTTRQDYITNYLFPYRLSPDSLLYLRTTYRHRPTFFTSDNNGRHRLRVKDISLEHQYSYKNGKIVYSAFRPDIRWGWRDYSEIRMIDVKTGKQKTITHKSKYFTPDISASGNLIAAVHIAPGANSELHILKADNGELINSIRSSDIVTFTDPKFIDDDSLVVMVRLRDGKMAMAMAEVASGNTVRLTPPSFLPIGYPCVENGHVFFTASYEGRDELFSLRLSDRKILRVAKSVLGSYFVNAADGKITWSAFGADGYQLQEIDKSAVTWEEVKEVTTDAVNTRFPVAIPGDSLDLLATAGQRNFPSSDYRKSTRLINIHSWRPYYEDPIFTYSLYGENVLNTLQTELYYLYNQDEATHAAGINAVYGGLFPYLQLGSEFTFNREGLIGNRLYQWNQLDTRFGFSIPLNFTNGASYKYLNFGSHYVLRNEFNKGFLKDSLGNTSFSYLLHTLSWSHFVPQAVQHIYPRWGVAISANHRHAISLFEGYQAIGNLTLYLPGAASNHSLVLTGSIQQRDTMRALFSTRFASARGYADYYRTTAGSRLCRVSANYHLPLWIPDWGFGNILYLQRIRANLFYDQQRIYSNDKKNSADLRSVGAEMYVDTKWWNQYPLTFGVRWAHILDNDPRGGNAKGSNLIEFILPVSIIPR